MTANTLTRHYDQLDTDERYRLMLAAVNRGDEVEIDRVMSAGKRVPCLVQNTCWIAQGTAFGSICSLTERLYFALLMEQCLHIHTDLLADRKPDEKTSLQALRICRVAQYAACMLSIHAEAMRRFRQEIGDEDGTNKELESFLPLARAEEAAEDLAWKSDEAKRDFQQRFGFEVLPTVDTAQNTLRMIRDEHGKPAG